MKLFRSLGLVLLGVFFFSATHPAFSEEGETAPQKTVDEKIDDLDQKVRILERRLELQQEGRGEKVKEAPGLAPGRDGFSFKSTDGDLLLRFRGVIQFDGRFLRPGTDTFVLSRVRPIMEGTLYNYVDFKFIPDFGLGKTVIQDAYFDIRYYPDASIQFGKTKAPFGLERLQADTDLRFVERALPTNLVPNRDIGIALHRDAPNGIFSYALGVFNGVPDGGSADADRNDNKDIVGRIFVQPFRRLHFEPIQGFGIGIAGSYGIAQGTLAAPDLSSYITVGQQTFFQYRSGTTLAAATIADGVRFRTSPQAYYYWGPFGLLGEYVLSSQEIRRDQAAEKIKNTAWQATASYLLTEERNSYGGVSPSRPFHPESGKWGAFEVAVRHSELSIDQDAFPTFADPTQSAREAKAWVGGVNWYLNRNVKFMFDYERTAFKGGAGSGEDRETEKAFLTRAQVAF